MKETTSSVQKVNLLEVAGQRLCSDDSQKNDDRVDESRHGEILFESDTKNSYEAKNPMREMLPL